MRKGFVLAIALALLCGAVFAQSAKVGTQVANTKLVPWTADSEGWTPILSTTIQTSAQKDLFIGVSLQTGLYTKTKISGKTAYTDTTVTSDLSSAEAGIKVRVKVAGQVVEPGAVWYDRRVQTLSGVLGQVLYGCADSATDDDDDITLDECQMTPEWIELLLKTMGAHHFNFVATDVGVGTHPVIVEAKIVVPAPIGEAVAKAAIGKGSLTVEEVRLVKGVEIVKM